MAFYIIFHRFGIVVSILTSACLKRSIVQTVNKQNQPDGNSQMYNTNLSSCLSHCLYKLTPEIWPKNKLLNFLQRTTLALIFRNIPGICTFLSYHYLPQEFDAYSDFEEDSSSSKMFFFRFFVNQRQKMKKNYRRKVWVFFKKKGKKKHKKENWQLKRWIFFFHCDQKEYKVSVNADELWYHFNQIIIESWWTQS